MFTVKQAAASLGVSAALVYGLCARKKIRHERHGLGRGTIRIARDALDDYRKSVAVGAEGRTATPPQKSEPVKLRHLHLPS